MITKSIYATGSKGHHRFTLNVQEDSISASDNSSLLSGNFVLTATHPSWQWRSYNNITFSFTIGTQTYTGRIPNFNGNPTTVASFNNLEITHESDGTKTIPISFQVTDPNTSVNYTCGNASESSTMILTDLHTPPDITNWQTTEQNNLIGSSFGAGKIVRYLSIKKYRISATTFDSATLSKFRVYNGTELLQEVTSSTSPTEITINYANVELQTFENSGAIYTPVAIEVEDSMGGITRRDWDFPVVNYQKPNIITTSSNIKRNGQSTGEVNLNLNATFTAGTIGNTTNDINTILLEFAYWKTNESESTTYFTIPTSAISISGNDLNIYNWTMQKNNVTINDVDVDDAYYFKIKFTDAFNNIGEVILLCNQGKYVMCKFKNRVDFLKATQKNNPILATSDFDDTNYEYIVLDNGLAMCWYQETKNIAITNSWNGGYLSGAITLSDFPIEFENPPIVFKSLDNITYTAIIASAISNASATTTNPGNMQLFRTASTNAQDYKINILAIGQIKQPTQNE